MIDVLQLLISGISLGCVYGLIALGFVLIYKATEMVNFAQGDIMMLGAFVAFTYINTLVCPSCGVSSQPSRPWPYSACSLSGWPCEG